MDSFDNIFLNFFIVIVSILLLIILVYTILDDIKLSKELKKLKEEQEKLTKHS